MRPVAIFEFCWHLNIAFFDHSVFRSLKASQCKPSHHNKRLASFEPQAEGELEHSAFFMPSRYFECALFAIFITLNFEAIFL
ncbi:hypothetical protein DU000_01015 [Parvibium lacunae]|uniref:Uncharacterized protein n=1 Tax=Parvibium lacunae TaxID=1888893 RepID=A0A368L6S8_9BURK|nr:hypothetical protein DU000_01015 [Parvibium lacunae]